MAQLSLSNAVAQGDLETIQAVLDAGADIRYVRSHGYTVMIDVMHGRSIREDAQLLPVIRLLIERGADLDAESTYGESALSVTARVGRFDAVQLLLDAGANPGPLAWTNLHRAVALGTLGDVEHRLDAGDDLSPRDRWHRTPLLLSVQAGDIAKAERLLAAGGSLADRGRCGKTPLMYAVENDDPAMLRWLLDQGCDPDEADDFGDTALITAASVGAQSCARVLLDAGADPNQASPTDTPIQAASTLAIARLLAGAGADFAAINDVVRDELTRRRRTDTIACTPQEYRAGRYRTFGTANPQLMNVPFWRAMVVSGQSAYHARKQFELEGSENEPVWCFARFGTSFTELPDGRVIEIGGEHEDSYDEDFCIYNDVIVHHGDGTFDLYGYPREIFPPTDFHTATLVNGFIYIIGSLGYWGERQYGTTPVYRLDVETLAIEPVVTRGELPGWISRHRARLVGNTIEVAGGKVCRQVDGEESYEDNPDRYVLDLSSMTWFRTGKPGQA